MQHAGPFVEDPNAAEPRVPRLPINVLDGFLEARVEYRTLAASGRVTGLVNGESNRLLPPQTSTKLQTVIVPPY